MLYNSNTVQGRLVLAPDGDILDMSLGWVYHPCPINNKEAAEDE